MGFTAKWYADMTAKENAKTAEQKKEDKRKNLAQIQHDIDRYTDSSIPTSGHLLFRGTNYKKKLLKRNNDTTPSK